MHLCEKIWEILMLILGIQIPLSLHLVDFSEELTRKDKYLLKILTAAEKTGIIRKGLQAT